MRLRDEQLIPVLVGLLERQPPYSDIFRMEIDLQRTGVPMSMYSPGDYYFNTDQISRHAIDL